MYRFKGRHRVSPALRDFLPAGIQGRIFRLETCLSLDGAPGTASELMLVVDAECSGTVEGSVEEPSCHPTQCLSVSHTGFSLTCQEIVYCYQQRAII